MPEIIRHDAYFETYKSSATNIDELINTLNIRIYDIGAIQLEPQWWCYQSTINSHCSIFHTENGTAFLFCNDRKVRLEPGKYYFFPSQTKITLPPNNDTFLYLAHFRISTLANVDIWHLLRPDYMVLDSIPDHLEKRFKHFCASAPETLPDQLNVCALIYEFFALFAAKAKLAFPEHNKFEVERIFKAVNLIDKNPYRTFRVTELAKNAGLGREHFTKAFKAIIGITPARYQMERKIYHIQNRLISDNPTLAMLAEEFGFSSAFHLSSIFKRYVGMSPREFRQQNHRDQHS